MSTEVQDLNERFIPDLKIDLIEYSKHNPRKFLDQEKLQELAKSIVQHGVVEPIVVRPHPKLKGRYEFCTDRECFDLKMSTYIDQKLIAAPTTLLVSSQWNVKDKGVLAVGAYKALDNKKDTCDSEMTAIFLDGDRAGHPVRVCINKKCEKHHSEIYRNASNHQQSADSAKQQREWRIEAASLAAMFKEAWDVPTDNKALRKGLSMEDFKLVAEYAWSRAYNRDKVAKAIGWTRVRAQGGGSGSYHAVADQFLRRANLPELVKFIMLMVCNDEISHNGFSPRSKNVKLSAVAKQWGADVLKARNKTRSELEAKYKAKAKTKKKAK